MRATFSKIITRYARRAGSGNHQRQCCRVGDFFGAMFKPFVERDSPHGISMLFDITSEAA